MTLPRRTALVVPVLISLIAPRLPGQVAPSPTQLVRGRVLDAVTGGPLADARVYTLGDSTSVSAITAANGAFSLRAPAGALRVVAARLGFSPDTSTVSAGGSTIIVRLGRAALALDQVLVGSERAYSSSASPTVRALDIQLRPRASSQALLGLVPGLVIAQHAGGGKAEQIFVRGFDADHGTDVAVSVDGVPVNVVSHAHGQGYADLHFLIPEVVERVAVRKGPFDAEDGDFATAGAVRFRTVDRVSSASAHASAGSFGTRRGRVIVPFGGDALASGGYLAADRLTSGGPFGAPQDHERTNVFGKWTMPVGGAREIAASLSASSSRWDASGQIPERAVRAGTIDRFGSIDPTEGGNTERYAATVGIRSSAGEEREWEVQGYATRYRFRLFSNFTFFLTDTVNGDGIEQVDDRETAGLTASQSLALPLFGRAGRLRTGAGARADRADVTLARQRERRRSGLLTADRIAQEQMYLWATQEIELSPVLALRVGMRGDFFRQDVRDRLPAAVGAVERGTGVRWSGIVSPKASLEARLTRATSLFANVGTGFHSNHARDAILASRSQRVLPRATSAEVGVRHTGAGSTLGVALWSLDLESEIVYVGDEGVTEPSGRTRRVGADVEARARIAPWLWADADLTLSRGRFRDEPDGANRIPLAPSFTVSGGLTVRDAGPLSGGVRARHIGSRSADETSSVIARGHTVWELSAGVRLSRARVVGAIDNVFGARWNEAQFATTSRLRGEPFATTELHFTPGAPRSVQLGVEVDW